MSSSLGLDVNEVVLWVIKSNKLQTTTSTHVFGIGIIQVNIRFQDHSFFQLAKRVSRSHFFVSSLLLIIFPIFLYFLPPKVLEPFHYQSCDPPKQHPPLPLPPCPQSPLIFLYQSCCFFLSCYLLFKFSPLVIFLSFSSYYSLCLSFYLIWFITFGHLASNSFQVFPVPLSNFPNYHLQSFYHHFPHIISYVCPCISYGLSPLVK